MRRKSNSEEAFDACGNMSRGQPSKHQLKKERKQARKERKRQKGVQPTIVKENAVMKNNGESGKFLLCWEELGYLASM